MNRDPGFGLEYVITSFTVFGNGCRGCWSSSPRGACGAGAVRGVQCRGKRSFAQSCVSVSRFEEVRNTRFSSDFVSCTINSYILTSVNYSRSPPL